MRYSILFVISLILVSGFIAYFGDLLGRKMGKKRLTVFNLRPRHTAVIATIITGMIISTVAFIALISVNSQFKKVLTQGEQILAQNDRLSRQNRLFEIRNASLISRREELKKLVVQRQREVDEARGDVRKAQSARNVALASVNRLQAEITSRKAELEKLRAKGDAAEKELAVRTREIEEVQARLEIAQDDLIEVGHILTTTRSELSRTENNLQTASKALKEQEAALDEQRQALAAQQEALVKIGKTAIEFERQTSELRSSELILRQGDEIARGVVSRQQSVFGIQGDIFSILQESSEKARKLGAIEGDNERTVKLIFRQSVNREYGIVIQDERVCLEMAKNAVAKGMGDALIQVVCARNSIAGEQVPVEFRLYANNLVYSKGKLVSQITIDGTQSEGRILLKLIDFIRTEISRSALRNGFIPVSNPDPRIAAAADTETQLEELMDIVNRIKTLGSQVKVYAYASADIYAVGPINMNNLSFSVRRVEDDSSSDTQ